ncbi:MAG: hypothetical protein WBM53_07550 [Maribacter sp.]
MENSLNLQIIEGQPVNLKEHYSRCKDIETNLLFYKDDLQSLKNILDTNFDDLVKNENLDELRESLMALQDLSYDNTRLLKQVKILKTKLLDTINGSSNNNVSELLNETSKLEKKRKKFISNYKIIKKELFGIVDDVLQIKN